MPKKVKIGDKEYLDYSDDVISNDIDTEDISINKSQVLSNKDIEEYEDLYIKPNKPLKKKEKKEEESYLSMAVPQAKKGIKSTLKFFDKLTVGVEKANSNLNIGEKVTITNGPFTNQRLIISGFIILLINKFINLNTLI